MSRDPPRQERVGASRRRAGRENADALVFDAACLRPDRVTGWERFTANLLRSMAPRVRGDLQILCRRSMREEVAGLAPESRIVCLPDGFRVIRDQVAYPLRAGRLRGPILVPGFSPPPLLAGRSYVFVHDIVSWRFPRTVSRGNRLYYRPLQRWAIARARGILTTSRLVREELLELGWVRDDRVRAVGAGVDPELLRAFEKLPRREAVPARILTVGTVEPRKNLGVLARAADIAARGSLWPPGTTIRVVGRKGWGTLDGMESMLWLGSLSDEDLAAEYRSASLLAFPTLYEGFGLPLVEAMAAGLAAAVSDIPVLREVGGDAPAYVDPSDPQAWAREIGRLLDDTGERSRRVQMGIRQAERHSYEKVADEILLWLRESGRRPDGRPPGSTG